MIKLGLVFLSLFLMSCAGAAPVQLTPPATQLPDAATASASAPVWKVGDNWTYSGSGGDGAYTYRYTVIGEGVFQGVAAYQLRTPRYTYWFTKDGLGFMARLKEGQVVRTITPPRNIHFPIKVGKSWVADVVWEDTARGSQKNEFTETFKIESYESVMVPAGTFKAFKVVRRTGAAFDEHWYSPEVKYNVKSRGRDRLGWYEEALVAYEIK